MKYFLIISALIIMTFSCKTDQQFDYETEIVRKIMSLSEIADSNLTILNFKQGQMIQYIHGDTIDIILNGVLFMKLISTSDSNTFNMLS